MAGQVQQGKRTGRGKTPRARRAIPLSAVSVRVLKWHKQNQAERAISPNGWNAGDLVFCSEIGTPLSPKSIGDQFDALLRKAELPDIRFHDMRHTYAALSIAAGVDIFTLSRRMGHSTISVTADRYGHLYQGHSQDVDALDRLLKRST
ncbi:MAG TPA: site-specific integrase [Roseiflexaceae bacterium]|nr:site-specific integrase [Roseiflexaceae bacterium]